MDTVNSIAFALDPNNVPGFLLDWEVTRLCNLDCSYCNETGHDNSTRHPPVTECLKSIDFMYEYVDLYMQHKKPSQRKVVLNVYGGESLFHPNIVEILKACRSKYNQYQGKWHLTVTCTTNAIVGANQWARIVPLIDEFTLSYHAENLPKQRQQYLDNAQYLKQHNKKFKCAVMMHNDLELFKDSESVIDFCKTNDMRFVAKPIENLESNWAYTNQQYGQLKTHWIEKITPMKKEAYQNLLKSVGNSDQVQSINEGRPCCGGRQLSLNGDLKSNVSFVPRQGFRGWSCSVNWFFLFVRQLTGDVYTNKDCQTSTTGRVEPLGNLSNGQAIINTLKNQLSTGTMPIIQCVKDICVCGFCAPKAESEEDFRALIKRNVPVDVFLKEC